MQWVGSLTIGDTIVAGNTCYYGQNGDFSGGFNSSVTIDRGYNLIGVLHEGEFSGPHDRVGNDKSPINPLLAPLGDYGGPTQTMPLLPGSPAIGTGDPGQTGTPDQRGFTRGSSVDIGAFQTQSSYALVVQTTGDVGAPAREFDLRGAIDVADLLGGSQAITFSPTVFATPQTITLTAGHLELSAGTVTITGPAAGVTLDAGGQSGVFLVDGGVTASLSGLTLTGGSTSTPGGGLEDLGTATLTDCKISGNSAGLFGGGMAVYPGATATLTGCTISGNSAPYGGGMITAGTTTLTDCKISGNSAGLSGGGDDDNGGHLTLTACTVTGNSAAVGGGVAVLDGGQATLTQDAITADGTGIAVGSRAGDTSLVTVQSSDLSGNATAGVTNNQTGAAYAVAATSDWWGSVTGPTNVGNPGGTGAAASGNVDFNPWLGDSNIVTPDNLMVLASSGNPYAVTPNGANTNLGLAINGSSVGTVTGGGSITFLGTGGTVTINGEAGSGSTDVFNVGRASVQFNAADGLKGSTINFLGTGLTRNVVAQGTTNTFNIQGSGTGGTPGSLVGDPGTNAFVFAAAATLAGGIQGAGSSTLNYSAYTTGVTVNLGNGTNGTATGISGAVAGITGVIGGRGNDTLNAGSVPGVALTGGPGINTLSGTGDSVSESLSSNYTLTSARLTGASPSFIDNLSGIAIAALTGSSATANSFTVSGWAGTGSLSAPAGTGTVIDSAAGSFTLNNAQLKAPNTTLALSGIATAKLTDSSATGGNTFTVTGWTGGGTLRGTSEKVVDAAAGGFALSNTKLSRAAGGSLTLTGFKTANLTDTSTGGNTFTVTGWTGGGSLTGPTATGAAADTVVDAASGNFTLSNASLSIGSLSMGLSGITAANLTDTGSLHTFTVNGWTGGGSLGSSVTGNTETLTASETAGLTLMNTSLALSGGGTMSLASFKAAKLTVTTASGNPQYVVDVSGFSNGPTNVTINGSGNAIVYGGTAGKSTLTAAGSGDDILIGAGAGDKLTDSGSGMNILIGGGPGGDTLTGNGNDILVSGATSYDTDNPANISALDAILAEWTSSDGYFARIGNIFRGVGALGADALNSNTVSQDAKANTLQDGTSQTQNSNWFLAWSHDVVKNKASETKTVL
jgi:hypothetical protein